MIRRLKLLLLPITTFFPVQLLVMNIKKNQVLLMFWLVLFMIISGNFGKNLGIPFLFLDPEYQNEVNFISLFIFGIAYGLFCISFYITSYILDSHRFHFLATIRRPFTHYCLNNSTIPFFFIIFYCFKFIEFQTQQGGQNIGTILMELSGFIIGTYFIQFITFFYFKKTNKDFFKEIANNLDITLRKKKINTVSVLSKINDTKKHYRIKTFIGYPLSFKKVEQGYLFDKTILFKIIDQNHLNAVAIEIVIFILILALGIFREMPSLQIPAAASATLLAAFFIMFTGAFSYWLRGWAITGIIIVCLCFNYLTKNNYINANNEAFGLNYTTEKAKYTHDRISKLSNDEHHNSDIKNTIEILENWKNKFPDTTTKPKIIFVCASGGGHRAAVWSMRTLQYLDSTLKGQLLDQTILMTGASGGLIGTSYYRELYLQKKLGQIKSTYDNEYFNNIGKDVLNPMVFSLVVSDMVLGFQQHEVAGQKYYKGRGYSFENQININTNNLLKKRVSDYRDYEQQALIPMVIMAPTIINDGRKLYISPQKISYMNSADEIDMKRLNTRVKGVEFSRFFEKQGAEDLGFMSALRMSATFPYITPNVHLPSEPEMVIMDAGMSDNFGMNDAVRFFHTFQEWIEENTSGAVFISIRDTDKQPFIKQDLSEGLWNKLFNPIAHLYNNLNNIQDLSNDNAIEFSQSWFGKNIDVINFEYSPIDWIEESSNSNANLKQLEKEYKKERASLSWHLTQKEKTGIYHAINNEKNKKALERLKTVLKSELE